MIGRLWTLYRVELSKLLARRLLWVGAVLVILLALAGPSLSGAAAAARAAAEGSAGGDEFQNGWTVLAGSVTRASFLIWLLAVVLSASSVAEEASWGTLRVICARPVRRAEWIAAKVLALWSLTAAILLAAVFAATASAELAFGLYDVVDPLFPDRVTHSFGDMRWFVLAATGASLVPLLALIGVGTFCSTLVDHPGHATGAAVGALVLLSAAGGLSPGFGEYSFVDQLFVPFRLVNDLANQYTGKLREFNEDLPRVVWVSGLWAIAGTQLAALRLTLRDVV
ncbi:MAG: ABC transporter permease [Planctomycetes bacterium]|nr:ABC transporter permease [Planctomycetota bacterium]